MFDKNLHGFHIRKWFSYSEEVLANETGKAADGPPINKFVIAAAIDNPYAGSYHEDLSRVIADSPYLGEAFGHRIQRTTDINTIESYGKAILVGVNGEYEHGNAFLTSAAANPVRDALGGGQAWVPSTGKIGVPGTILDIPLAHKDALYVRSHYDTVSVSFNDAPRPNEVVIVWAFATRGRLHARLGGLAAEDAERKNGLT
ncbi:MAG: amino acid synthesis family protein [Pseudomonadota bacterium]